MKERSGLITMKGNPLMLLGDEISVGDKAPQFTCMDNDLNPVSLSSFKGKVIILSTVPSLDTPVCDMETRRFNQEAAELDDDVVIITVSMDLPFAQKRWCGAAGVDKVVTLSDYMEGSLGIAYGIMIKELRLHTRAVYVIDREGTVQYAQIVPEIADEPDYGAALKSAKNLL